MHLIKLYDVYFVFWDNKSLLNNQKNSMSFFLISENYIYWIKLWTHRSQFGFWWWSGAVLKWLERTLIQLIRRYCLKSTKSRPSSPPPLKSSLKDVCWYLRRWLSCLFDVYSWNKRFLYYRPLIMVCYIILYFDCNVYFYVVCVTRSDESRSLQLYV